MKYQVTYTDGQTEAIEAERVVASSTKRVTLPYYEFYIGQAVARRVFAHALREALRDGDGLSVIGH